MGRRKDRQTDSNAIGVRASEQSSEVENAAQQETEQPIIEEQPLRGLLDRLQRLTRAYWSKKRLAIPVTILVIITSLGAVPFSRYALLGLAIHNDMAVTVVDSRTNTPISKAAVAIGGHGSFTSASGTTRVRSKVGYQTLTITKQYYKTYHQGQLVALSESRNQVTVKLVALGRLVPVTVTNKLTGKPIAGVTVKALDTEATTSSTGVATAVLPATAATQEATISASGYNTLSGSIVVTDQTVAANSFALTPAGKLYFLSNLSGKIDVVKTDLDGTNRQTVLAGTGYENQYNTVLLASRDWKYLALYAQRKAAGGAEIDLIDTSTDVMSNIDEGNANFTLVGWDGDSFIYQVNRNGVTAWQNGQQALKSFNASTKKITVLAQTLGTGTGQFDYLRQLFGDIYILDGKVVYPLTWEESFYGDRSRVYSKQATLGSVSPDGSNNTVLKALSIASGTQTLSVDIIIRPYDGPNSIAFYCPEDPNTYYEYQSGKVAAASDITSQTFSSNTYNTYLLSPSGNKAFWSVYADGKNNLTVGDQNGQNAKTIALESDYSPYGWFTDDYLLVQKAGSELYVISSGGTSQPFKITNYYKPQVSYRGYGGGYGGL